MYPKNHQTLGDGKVFSGGRDLLKEGHSMRIGRGFQTKALSQEWIPGIKLCEARKENLIISEDRWNLKVSNLINHAYREWHIPVLQELFKEKATEKILLMHIPSRHFLDEWNWRFTKSGKFTVKSGYHMAWECYKVAKNKRDPPVVVHQQLWDKIWKLNLPAKIILFMEMHS